MFSLTKLHEVIPGIIFLNLSADESNKDPYAMNDWKRMWRSVELEVKTRWLVAQRAKDSSSSLPSSFDISLSLLALFLWFDCEKVCQGLAANSQRNRNRDMKHIMQWNLLFVCAFQNFRLFYALERLWHFSRTLLLLFWNRRCALERQPLSWTLNSHNALLFHEENSLSKYLWKSEAESLKRKLKVL